MCEKQRLDFIIERDGLVEAVAFAKRTMVVYRKSVLKSQKRGFEKPHHASFREFRRKFIQSYCDFKRFISDNAQRITKCVRGDMPHWFKPVQRNQEYKTVRSKWLAYHPT